MIFVTVGTQFPFDRLVAPVLEWADKSGTEVLAQVGPRSSLLGRTGTFEFLDEIAYEQAFGSANVVVSHFGMGTLLRCREEGKPLLMLPRQADLGEHRNDHQVDGARSLQAMLRGVLVHSSEELLDRLRAGDFVPPARSGLSGVETFARELYRLHFAGTAGR